MDECIEAAHYLKKTALVITVCPTANPNTNGPTLEVIGRYY